MTSTDMQQHIVNITKDILKTTDTISEISLSLTNVGFTLLNVAKELEKINIQLKNEVDDGR